MRETRYVTAFAQYIGNTSLDIEATRGLLSDATGLFRFSGLNVVSAPN
jgi:hypothetical protein